MPYTPPLWDDDQWLPQEQLAGPILPHTAVPPRFATPPFLPAGPPPIDASTPARPLSPPRGAPPTPPPAFEAAAAGLAQKPMHSDPAFEPSTTRKVLGGLAGVALGAGAGFVNAGGRAKVDPDAGAVLADSIVNAKFNKANRDYQERQAALSAQAKLEQARADDERKTREAQAKIENYKSQAGAADARKAQSERPAVAKPIVLPDGTVLSGDGTQTVRTGVPKPPNTPQSVDQAINQIRLDPNRTDEVKDGLIAQIVKDHNTAHPEKAITKIVTNDKGELTAVTVTPSAVAAAGGKMALGAGGKATKVAAAKTAGTKPTTAGGLSAAAQGVMDGSVDYWKRPGKERAAIFAEIRRVDPHWSEPTATTAGERTIQSNAESAMRQAEELKKTLEANKDSVGPLAGLARYIPGSHAQVLDADIKLAKQRIGKVLEGGVLRKEDEKKYKDILAELSNNPKTALGKMDNIITTLQRDIGIARDTRNKAGRAPQAGGAKPPSAQRTITTSGPLKAGQYRRKKDGGLIYIKSALANGEADYEDVPE